MGLAYNGHPSMRWMPTNGAHMWVPVGLRPHTPELGIPCGSHAQDNGRQMGHAGTRVRGRAAEAVARVAGSVAWLRGSSRQRDGGGI